RLRQSASLRLPHRRRPPPSPPAPTPPHAYPIAVAVVGPAFSAADSHKTYPAADVSTRLPPPTLTLRRRSPPPLPRHRSPTPELRCICRTSPRSASLQDWRHGRGRRSRSPIGIAITGDDIVASNLRSCLHRLRRC
ncbi:Os05g0234366, partial [Oryza sativa Japonica Group]